MLHFVGQTENYLPYFLHRSFRREATERRSAHSPYSSRIPAKVVSAITSTPSNHVCYISQFHGHWAHYNIFSRLWAVEFFTLRMRDASHSSLLLSSGQSISSVGGLYVTLHPASAKDTNQASNN